MSRPGARKEIFKGYEYVSGKLARTSHLVTDVDSPSPARLRNNGKIIRRLNDSPVEIGAMALSLAVLAEQEIEREESAKPNNPVDLLRWEAYRNFLQQLAEGLRKLHDALASATPSTSGPIEQYKSSVAIISGLQTSIEDWIRTNTPTIVDGAARIALIGAGTSFLAWCGAPVAGAFGVASILTGGAKVAEMVGGAIKQAKGKSE